MLPHDPRLAGMTVNERLFAVGLLEAWDQAIATCDRAAAHELLSLVDLAEQAADIVDFALGRQH